MTRTQKEGALCSIECRDGFLAVHLPETFTVVSWAVLGGPRARVGQVVWHQVTHKDLPPQIDPGRYLAEKLQEAGFSDAVGFMTSHPVTDYIDVSKHRQGLSVQCVATVGLSNALRVGDPPLSGESIGTINILCILSMPLSQNALSEALAIVGEAKTAACLDHGVQSPVSGLPATGTGTDYLAVAAQESTVGARYAGKHTVLGYLIGDAVYQAMIEGIGKWKAP